MRANRIVGTTVTGFESGLRVSHIAALGLRTCSPSEQVTNVLSNLALKDFDQIPVRDGAQIVGVVERKPGTAEGSVRDHMRSLDHSILVSAEEPLRTFLPTLDKAPYRLVVTGPEIKGIVTLSDVGKLPVRLMAFTLVTHLELVLADLIRRRYGDSSDWLPLLGPKQREKIEGHWKRREMRNLHIPLLDVTDLGHKITVVGKFRGLSDWETRRKQIVGLRNSLGHASDFIEACKGVSSFLSGLRSVEHWIGELGFDAAGRRKDI